MWTVYNDKTAKEICYGCGSDISKKTYAYFHAAQHYFYSADKVMSEIYDGKALYFATRAKNHIRLIEIAVRTEYQGQGIGRKVLNRLLTRAKALGTTKITLRTPINEKAAEFWLHMGAKIIGLKDNDYEMELNIK